MSANHRIRTVVKLGGSAMEDPAATTATLRAIAALAVSQQIVVVHGGGKAIDRAMADARLTPAKIQGRRVTDEASLAIVVRVLKDQINADLLRQLRLLNVKAVGLADDSLAAPTGSVLRMPGIDLGRVGIVTGVAAAHDDAVAVYPSLARDEAGWLNVNADTAAAAIAIAVRADRLVMLTDTPGILRDRRDPASLIHRITVSECRELLNTSVIDAGMLPKVDACFDALAGGVASVRILDGRRPDSLLTDDAVGTTIVRDDAD